MNIGDIIKIKLKELEKRKKEIKEELSKLHTLRNKGQVVEDKKFKILGEELYGLKNKIKDFKKIIKGT